MANSVAGLFETLVVPAATNGKLTNRYKNIFLTSVFNGFKNEFGKVGQTMEINVPVVAEADVANIGSGPIELTDTNTVPVPITITNKQSVSKSIQSFDSIRTPLDLQEQYLGPMIESLLRKCNRDVANLMTTTNFTNYSAVSGGTNVFTRLNIAAAWSNVAGTGGAPVNKKDTFFITDNVAYGNMLGDPAQNFIQQYVVGEAAALEAQQDARIMPQFSAQLDWDQMMPVVTSGKHGGIFYHRYAVGMLPVMEPPPKDSYVRQMTMYMPNDTEKRFPICVQFWHDPKAQGHVLHVFAMYGLKVVKPEWGSYCETT